jgi:hypothetical protein
VDFDSAMPRFESWLGSTAGCAPDNHASKPFGASITGNSAKWTVVTYLLFLWRPDTHMFLKPEVTKDFAARVGHRFASDYEARLHLPVYESLLDLVAKTAPELSDLKPQDGIDIQSFIWVVGDYREDREDVYI